MNGQPRYKRRYQTTADVEARYGVQPGPRPPVEYIRVGPLTTNQHILHLLVTVFTFGLWAPVWIWLAVRGQQAPRQPGQQPWAPRPGWQGSPKPQRSGCSQHRSASGRAARATYHN
jgi:hypothetical protein